MEFWFDAVFGRILGTETYGKVKEILSQLAQAVEGPGNGTEKKKLVVELAIAWVKSQGLRLPFGDWILSLVLGLVVDAIVAHLNSTGLFKHADGAVA